MPPSAPTLFGRRHELETLDASLESARAGLGAALVLTGEPGIGKSTLLGHAASMFPGGQVRSVVGVEAESAFAFAGLHRLLRRDLDRLGELSPGHRSVMGVAVGLEPGDPVDAKLVGLALLSLLSDLAGPAGCLVCVDDAQWLDAESLHALGFAARRVHAEGVTMLFGIRSGAASTALAGLPTIELAGLGAVDAVELLRRSIDAPISDEVAARIVDATAGNPLALTDLGRVLTAAELSGATAVPDPIPLGDQLHVHYRQQIHLLTAETRSWLLVAAAEPSADVAVVSAAARAMEIDPAAADDAEAAGVVTIRRQVRFRHPLVRSAVYGGATPAERRAVHRALASVMAGSTDATRRAWHLAAAASDVDDDLADELDRCADEARSRGGGETAATLLARAADLTSAPSCRARRLVSAAESAFAGGSLVQARALLERGATGVMDDALTGRALALRARIDIRLGEPNAERDAAIRCLEAASTVGGRTIAGRAALLGACEHSVVAAAFAGPADVRAVADAIERTGPADEPDPGIDGLLGAFAAVVDGRWRDAVEFVRSSTDALDANEIAVIPSRDVTMIATSLCSASWERQRLDRVLERAAATARASGALSDLDSILYAQSMADTTLGDLARAEQRLVEGHQIRSTIGAVADDVTTLFRHPELLAWTGADPDFPTTMATILGASEQLGNGAMATLVHAALGLHHLARGEYDAARVAAELAVAGDPIGVNTWVPPMLAEAAARAGDDDVARSAVRAMSARAEAAGNNWSLGVLARARAIVDATAEAEHAYRRSIALLTPTPARADLARSHLVYGEWLRRRKRRSDARRHLRAAHSMFVGMGAASFAERARTELLATGERASIRTAQATRILTPQEEQVARLAADGMTNAEIGSRLFISAKTVDYHLGKIYRKLGIDSRRQLRGPTY